MTEIQLSWREFADAIAAPLSADVERVVLGEPWPDAEASSHSRVRALTDGAVESRILGSLPCAVAVLACSRHALRSLTVVRTPGSTTVGETVTEGLLQARDFQFVSRDDAVATRSPFTPFASEASFASWRSALWTAVCERFGRNDRVGRLTCEAGLRLIHDDLDGSHRCSQAIEGEGPANSGDYWHAIMHRREPDYGNSKYWFRHVGEHPIFPRLVEEWMSLEVDSDTVGRTRSPVQASCWNPAAFVDACESAAHAAADLRQPLEEMQHREMLHLLAWCWVHTGD